MGQGDTEGFEEETGGTDSLCEGGGEMRVDNGGISKKK